MTEPTEQVRLHISPLTPDILPAVLPASIRSTATDISYHSIPTFPENSYGYVTLSKMDADKIKKKLNGSILKGKKFKVETARPSKRPLEKEDAEPEVPKEKKKSKKSKSEDQTLDGFELPSDRKVKRGWTEPKSAKDKRKYEKKKSKDEKKEKLQAKSKYTEKSECLFRTKLPPNRASDAAADDKKAKRKHTTTESVVHEFAKATTYPSFLRSSGDDTAKTATFDEEKGWIDTTGSVKEAVSEKTQKKDYRPGKVAGVTEKRPVRKIPVSSPKAKTPEAQSSESEDYTSSSGSSDESSDSESETEASSDDPDSESSADEEVPAEAAPEEKESSPESVKHASTTVADESNPELASEPAQDVEEAPKEVHPLEALFKRSAPAESDQAPPNAEAGFSFFGNSDDIESEEESRAAEPQTPFTPFAKRDLQDRGMRSAAPTPDTAAASRHMQWNNDDMEEDESPIDTPVSKSRTEGSGDKDETEFAKWFWENRGDNNRAWKKRRRDAAKEQRQRENRKKGMKGRS
ncbi:Nucleotide-binding alpha-beta plait [Penicillium odoratum]|uniref:Nucleotide-binding alpha-beta plait n=1 Tax=Penicillium odoratum TaxID=1167516 RepID=UPI002547C51B|nr:Nucleotide-binding alpha-beta plait [Penicillium odoratum]KAJ5752387.1 Nucleotide-binding alpha-beta plait [Penicillium odoratum]